MFGQSVRLNSKVGLSSMGHTMPTPGKPGYRVLARSTPGVSTEMDKLQDEAREIFDRDPGVFYWETTPA